MSIAAGRTLYPPPRPPFTPTAFRPRGKHLPLRCVRMRTSNHYGAVMSWARSVAASLERQCASFSLMWSSRVSRARMAGGGGGRVGATKAFGGRGRGLCRRHFYCGGWNSALSQGYQRQRAGKPGCLCSLEVSGRVASPSDGTEEFQRRKFPNAHGSSPSF